MIIFVRLQRYCFPGKSGNMGQASLGRAEWLGVLETAAKVSAEKSSAMWVWIMQELRLGPQYFLAIREAVHQGRWRTARNPKAYIKTIAKREAHKMATRKLQAKKRWNIWATTTTAAMQPKAKTQSGGPEQQESGIPAIPLRNMKVIGSGWPLICSIGRCYNQKRTFRCNHPFFLCSGLLLLSGRGSAW